ncbi:TetR/AcrR family transcriptional regulator [Cryobacterium sp. N21]|uniref:TetR/AcrR family transcriptional regulator n=1 Tax=Cryobacterium sp. N21 TaxID=2048289 RepID=UPI001304FAFA|nr:TetR/AcrR family transcriptional regulator [Cryobacterium sp. N21]
MTDQHREKPIPPSRRSSSTHEAVLRAAIELFEKSGYSRMTIDAIADRAGASKATIYRWWAGKGAILLEAFLSGVEADIAFPDSGTLREDLVAQVSALAHVLGQTNLGQMAIALLGEAQHDTQLAAAFRSGWLEPRRTVGREVLFRATERGELRADLDLEVVLDGLYGPVYLRLLFGHGPLDRPTIETLIDQVLQGIARQKDAERKCSPAHANPTVETERWAILTDGA